MEVAVRDSSPDLNHKILEALQRDREAFMSPPVFGSKRKSEEGAGVTSTIKVLGFDGGCNTTPRLGVSSLRSPGVSKFPNRVIVHK